MVERFSVRSEKFTAFKVYLIAKFMPFCLCRCNALACLKLYYVHLYDYSFVCANFWTSRPKYFYRLHYRLRGKILSLYEINKFKTKIAHYAYLPIANFHLLSIWLYWIATLMRYYLFYDIWNEYINSKWRLQYFEDNRAKQELWVAWAMNFLCLVALRLHPIITDGRREDSLRKLPTLSATLSTSTMNKNSNADFYVTFSPYCSQVNQFLCSYLNGCFADVSNTAVGGNLNLVCIFYYYNGDIVTILHWGCIYLYRQFNIRYG